MKNPKIVLPYVSDAYKPVWHYFGIRCEKRDALERYLNERGIGIYKHYPIPMHLQERNKDLSYSEGNLLIAEEIRRTELKSADVL